MADYAELVSTILAKTREGKLEWEQLSATGFLTRVGSTMIVVDRTGVATGLAAPSPTLRITDESGKVLEVIHGPILSGGEGIAPKDLLTEIYEVARRQALRVADALVLLKRSLDNL